MKKCLEKIILNRLDNSEKKGRYNFTLSPTTKLALSKWCKDKNKKESPTLEALIIEMIPKKYFQ